MKTLLIASLLLTSCSSVIDYNEPDATSNPPVTEIEVGSIVVTTVETGVYKRNNVSSALILDLPKGEKGVVTRSLNNNMWRVQFSNVHGWAVSDNLALSDVTPPPPSARWFLGGLGCSMFRDQLDPGMRENTQGFGAWEKDAPDGNKVLRSYSGGTISAWGSGDNNKWNAFDAGLAQWPQTNILLYEVCMDPGDSKNDVTHFLPHVQYIADEIASRVDTSKTRLYVVGQPDYTSGQFCSLTGADGAAFAQQIAQMMADSTWAQAADFVLGPLTPEDIRTNDDCHVNAAGAKKEALQIEAWLETL